jgi:hypothetical protein
LAIARDLLPVLRIPDANRLGDETRRSSGVAVTDGALTVIAPAVQLPNPDRTSESKTDRNVVPIALGPDLSDASIEAPAL